MNRPKTVGDVAALVRSKNAGPFWLTIDMFIDTADDYRTLAAPDVLTAERIAALYHVDPQTIEIFRLDELRAIKISFPRPTSQGGVRDRDMHAGQQHIPILHLALSPKG